MIRHLNTFRRPWPLKRQLILVLGGIILLTGLVVGEVIRDLETNYLQRSLEQQSHKTLSILVATSLDAVISEDRPVLETIVTQSVLQDPDIVSLRVDNEYGNTLVVWGREGVAPTSPRMEFSEDIVYEGENFGRMHIAWDVRSLYEEIDAHISKMRRFAIGGLLGLGIVLILWVYKFVTQPLQWIHQRLEALSRGKNEPKVNLSAARELVYLGESVNMLADSLQLNRRREAELQRAQRVIGQERDRALEATRVKSQFLATMSHELRTPMNGVIGMTGLLLDTELTAEQREFAEIIRSSGETLLRIINDVLDFSRIEAEKLPLEVIDFELRATVEDVLELFAEHAYSKGLELACLVHANVPTWVKGDPGRLRQILNNFVGNAVKFTETGEVVVHVTLTEETDNDVCIHFAVIDTGIGIPSETQSRLFQAFTQADSSTTRKYGGTGLGLVISKRLAELMGGSIGVESTPGQGSTFWFTVPLSKCSPSGSVAHNVLPELHNLRVLCVDANATHRSILQAQMSSWGMEVDSVADGRQALEQLRTEQRNGQPYALVLFDMYLPDMDGLTLASAIKADPSLASVRLVMLTSFGQRGQAADAQQEGIAAYLTKPVRQSQLYNCFVMLMSSLAELPGASPITRHRLAEAKAQGRVRVLVAEDNIVNQRVAVRMLEHLGCRVDVAANGSEAVEALARIPYDLIFMDCQMPEMDGYEATAAIRARETLTGIHIPIVAMTANAMQGDREQCLQAGMDDYVSKPVTTENLLEILQKWVSQAADASPVPDTVVTGTSSPAQ